MIKKYNFYNNTDIPLDFEVLYNTQISLKGTYSIPLGCDNSFAIGSSLQIQLNDISNIQKRILTLNYLIGFGEKTSLGFGCMNKVEYTKR